MAKTSDGHNLSSSRDRNLIFVSLGRFSRARNTIRPSDLLYLHCLCPFYNPIEIADDVIIKDVVAPQDDLGMTSNLKSSFFR